MKPPASRAQTSLLEGASTDPADGDVFVQGVVSRVTYESDSTGFRVLRLDVEGQADKVTVVGKMPKLHEGARIRVRGQHAMDAKFGPQIRALSVTELEPDTLVGLGKYLASGLLRGVGPKTAERIVETFGLDTMRVLDEEPWRLRKVGGIGQAKADAIATEWQSQRSIRDVMVFLQSHGASSALAYRVHKRYGADAVRVVQEDPYRLSLEVWGIGFRTADRIAMQLGLAKDDPRRLEAGILQSLRDASDAGHVMATEQELDERAALLLDTTPDAARVSAALAVLAQKQLIVREHADAVYPIDLYSAETRLAARVRELVEVEAQQLHDAEASARRFEQERAVELAAAQRRAILLAAKSGLLVVTGGPGVGKTTLVRAILSMYERVGLEVRLAAPTGRAAKRLAESTGHAAMTLHRLLDFDPRKGAFKRDARNPLDGQALVVDEASMMDVELAASLFDAVPAGMRVVLVGDVDQLPSVGPGAVLRDFIDSRAVDCVHLDHIFRQGKGSLIVENAHRINQGELPQNAEADHDSDFFLIERTEPEEARRTLLELVRTRIPRRFGLDALHDVQVLTPMHRGPVGSQQLNADLQAALNPEGTSLTRGERLFRVGDKVMQLRNDYDKEVFNGDVGFITAVDAEEGSLSVRFDEREVGYEAQGLDELTLAYATSIHKSQGSEYPAVVIPLLTSHFVMLSRNLVYTGVTRGKRLVVLVGDPRALRMAVGRDGSSDRRTGLQRRLAEAHATV